MFMRPEIIFTKMIRIGTFSEGDVIVPADYLGLSAEREAMDYIDGEIPDEIRSLVDKELGIPPDDIESVCTENDGNDVWAWRLNASGYLDCTPWCVEGSREMCIEEILLIHDIHWCAHCEEWVDSPLDEDDAMADEEAHVWNNSTGNDRMVCRVDGE